MGRQRRAARMDEFRIDPKSPVPVWAQTKSRLLYLILSGRYQEGDKLPTVRDLAVELNINYNTVNKAYQDLERDGYVLTTRGKGSYVTDKAREGFFAIESDVDFLIQELIEKATAKGMTGEELAMRLVGRLRSEGRISAKAVEEVQESTQEVG